MKTTRKAVFALFTLLVAVMFVAVLACGLYLLTRGPEPIAAEEPAPA